MHRIPSGAEATTVLVGSVDYLTKPAVAFVRLAEGKILDNLTEVPLPVRFLFLLLGPEDSGMDYHEVGRSISTLMSNQVCLLVSMATADIVKSDMVIPPTTKLWGVYWFHHVRPFVRPSVCRQILCCTIT